MKVNYRDNTTTVTKHPNSRKRTSDSITKAVATGMLGGLAGSAYNQSTKQLAKQMVKSSVAGYARAYGQTVKKATANRTKSTRNVKTSSQSTKKAQTK